MTPITSFKIEQTDKWQLFAVTTISYPDGMVYFDTDLLADFADLKQQYMTVVFKRDYNRMCKVTRTDDNIKALKVYNARYNTLSTSHAAIVTSKGDDAIKAVQGRDSYRIFVSDCKPGASLVLVAPAGILL